MSTLKTTIGSILGVLAVAGVAPSHAQSGPTVESNGECPQAFIDFLASTPDRRFAYSAVEGLNLFRTTTSDELVRLPEGTEVTMREQLEQAQTVGGRILVSTKDDTGLPGHICGWAPADLVLESGFSPLLVNELNFDSPNREMTVRIAQRDGTTRTETFENPLQMKMLLRSNPEAKTVSSSAGPRSVPIFDSPFGFRNEITTVAIFSIFYVYDKVTLDGSDWYFIGGNEPVKDSNSIAGWVHEDFVFQWETQVSLYFDEDRISEADIYARRDLLARQDKGGIIGFHPRLEDGSESIEPLGSNIARFPILNHDKVNEDVSVFNVGFFGSACGRNSDDCISGQEALAQSSTIIQEAREFSNIDVLFVIDNSKSMSPYFASVVDGVKDAVQSFEGNQSNLRVAAAVYGDFTRKSDNPSVSDLEWTIVSGFPEAGDLSGLEKLNRLASSNRFFADAAYKDLPEAGSAALVKALSDSGLRWREDALKQVIWIGDHGDRRDDSLVKRLDTAARLYAENGVLLNAINVAGNYNELVNGTFIETADLLSAEVRKRADAQLKAVKGDSSSGVYEGNTQSVVRLAYDAATAGNSQESIARTRVLVKENIQSIHQEALAIQDVLMSIYGGKVVTSSEIQKEFPMARLGQINDALKLAGYDEGTIRRISEQQQTMIPGHVAYQKELQNFRFWINIPGTQVEDLYKVMDATCDAFDQGNVESRVEDAMISLVSNLSGDVIYDRELTIGEMLVKYLFIPHEYFGTYLDFRPDQIQDVWNDVRLRGDPIEIRNVYEPICKSAYLLQTVLDDQRVSDPVDSYLYSENGYGFEAKTPDHLSGPAIRDFDWLWASTSGIDFYFVPAEYFPGKIVRTDAMDKALGN